MLTYKAAEADVLAVQINPRNTTQRCSSCGSIVPKTLAMRKHKCPDCGLIIDRDINAARNILQIALNTVGTTGINVCGAVKFGRSWVTKKEWLEEYLRKNSKSEILNPKPRRQAYGVKIPAPARAKIFRNQRRDFRGKKFGFCSGETAKKSWCACPAAKNLGDEKWIQKIKQKQKIKM